MMMSFMSLGVVAIVGGPGVLLAFAPGNAQVGGRRACFQWRRRRGQRDDSAPALHVLSGHVRIITAALSPAPSSSVCGFCPTCSSVTLWSIVGSPIAHWVWAAVGCRWAPLTSPAARCARQRRRRARRRQGGRTAALLPVGRAPAPQHFVHAAGRRTVVVRLVRLHAAAP